MCPEEWNKLPLSSVVYFQEGPGLRRWQYRNEGMPFLNIRCIKEGSLDLSAVQYISQEEANDKYEHFFLNHGDIVLSSSGSLGRLALVDQNDLPLMLNTSVIRFRSLDENICCGDFLRYFLQSSIFINQIINESQGSAQANFGPTHLKKVTINFPDLSEQKQIATILSSVDDAIKATRAVIDQTRRVKQGLMQQLLTRGIGHTRFKQTEIGEIPEEWEVSTIGQACKVTSGGTPNRNKPEFWDGKIPWVKTGEINYSMIFNTNEKITEDGLLNSSATMVPNGSLLMAMYGQGKTRGKVALLGIDATINQACLAILPHKHLHNEFLYHFLTREYIYLRSLSHEGSQKNLNAALIKQVQIPIPSISEQYQITKILNSVDSVISAEKKTLVTYQKTKRGLMQDLLTGRVRVKFDGEATT